MPKINITFVEEGSTPVTVELPEATALALEMFISDQVVINEEGIAVSKYSGKAELFLKHTTDSLITPIVEKYGSKILEQTAIQIQNLEQQKKELENSLKQSFVPKIITPSN